MAANNIYIQVDFNSQSAQQNVNALNQAIGQTGPAAEKSSKQATTALNQVNVSVNQTAKAFGELTGALAGLGIARVAQNIVQVSSELGRAHLMMTTYIGDAKEAKEVMDQIRVIAAQGVFNNKDLQEAGERLAVFGWNAKQIPITLKIISDQLAATGGSVENLTSLVSLFGRVMNKESVSAMDLFRLLPQQGAKVTKALAEAMKIPEGPGVKEKITELLKSGAYDPMTTLQAILRGMQEQTHGAGALIDDLAKSLKNLGDALDAVKEKLTSGEGFGKQLKLVTDQIGALLTVLGAFIGFLMKLPDGVKTAIVELGALAAVLVTLAGAFKAFAFIFGPAVRLIATLGPLLGEVLAAVAAPEIVAVLAGIAAIAGGFAALFPKLTKQAEDWVHNLWQGLKDKVTALARTSGFLPPENVPPPEPLTPAKDPRQEIDYDKLQAQVVQWSDAAGKTLLGALSSPAEAVYIKYADLFTKLDKLIADQNITAQHAAELRLDLTHARTMELQAKEFEEWKRQNDERTKYESEKIKGSYDAQIAYIESLDEQNLRQKVADIDKVANLRAESAKQVAKEEEYGLERLYNAQKEMLDKTKPLMEALFGAKQGDQMIDQAILERHEEMMAKQELIDQKAVDDGQKYRLEGWKKANDAIIEDQKRVFDAFKSMFDQLFDAFTSKHPGQAVADVFKKLALDQAKEIFSSQAASFATQAAGYGTPEPGLARGGGILAQLFQRGMPPRPRTEGMPELYTPTRAGESGVSYGDVLPDVADAKGTANRFAIATNSYDVATLRFAQAVSVFAGATAVSSQGSADRMMADGGVGPSSSEAAMLSEIRRRESGGNYGAQNIGSTASGAYQFIDKTWRMATQATGIGRQYGTAKEAPQSVQDANALYLLRRYGPNSTASWAASGPYGAGAGTGGADFSTTVYAPRDIPGFGGADFSSIGPGGTAPFAGAMAAPGMMNLPTTDRGAQIGSLLLSSMKPIIAEQQKQQQQQLTKPLTDLFSKYFGGSYAGSGGLSRIGTNISQYGAAFNAPDATTAAKITALSTGPFAGTPAGPAAGAVGMMLAGAGIFGEQRGRGAGVLEATAGGFLVAGPIGAAVGAGISLGEMAAGVEAPRYQVKRLASTLYHIHINNATADSIVNLAQQSFGGNIAVAMRSPQVRQMLGVYAAGTGQAGQFPAGLDQPHGASLVESGGVLQQQATYEYGNPYTYSSNLPVYGGQPTHVLSAPGGGMQLSLNIAGQDAATFLQGNVVSPNVVSTQLNSAMNSSNGRVAQALMMSEPGTIVG
jgi:hypothetical protein